LIEMKVLLLKDVYKLGRAGDVKRVADGYGRNYLLPQGLAVLATEGALKQVEHIRNRASASRTVLNKELSGVAERISSLTLAFPMKAGETGKLYGSITPQMIAEAITAKAGTEVDRRQVDVQPIRNLGQHTAHVRLTIDLVPTVTVIVHREGENPMTAVQAEAEEAELEEFEEVEEVVEEEEVEEVDLEAEGE
jgi:large subunit ribosomal protein L9